MGLTIWYGCLLKLWIGKVPFFINEIERDVVGPSMYVVYVQRVCNKNCRPAREED